MATSDLFLYVLLFFIPIDELLSGKLNPKEAKVYQYTCVRMYFPEIPRPPYVVSIQGPEELRIFKP